MVQSPFLSAQKNTIEEVIVTAQKREQNMQDVGIVVTTFTSYQLRDFKLYEPKDIASQTPGLDIKNAVGNTNPVITIRGVGLNDYNSNNNPSTAAHVNEVYMASSAYLSFQLFDIERIEVLKGPQGTLYGRNSTAGTVNFITARPTEELDASMEVGYGNYNTLDVRGHISNKITENLSGRFAFMTRNSGGHIENDGTIGNSAGDARIILFGDSVLPGPVPAIGKDDKSAETDVYAWRASFDWIASDDIDIFFSIHGSEDTSNQWVYSLRTEDAAGFSAPDDDPFTVYSDFEPTIDSSGLGGSLRIDWDLPVGTLTSVTGYEELDRVMGEEDASPYRLTQSEFFGDLYEITQEIRLTSTTEDDSLF